MAAAAFLSHQPRASTRMFAEGGQATQWKQAENLLRITE